MIIDWSKAPEWAEWHGLSDTGFGIKGFWLGHTEYQEVGDLKAYPYGDAGDGDTAHNHRFPEFQHVTVRPKKLPATTITTRMAMLEAALRDCVRVMSMELGGLLVIQPELRQAEKALEDMYLVDDEFEPWNGEGLPPVGTVCEIDFTLAGGNFEVAEIIAHIHAKCMDCAVYRVRDEVSYASSGFFRTIRTAEQIAAEERDNAVTSICLEVESSVARFNTSLDTSAAMRAVVEALYDAGYRKQVRP